MYFLILLSSYKWALQAKPNQTNNKKQTKTKPWLLITPEFSPYDVSLPRDTELFPFSADPNVFMNELKVLAWVRHPFLDQSADSDTEKYTVIGPCGSHAYVWTNCQCQEMHKDVWFPSKGKQTEFVGGGTVSRKRVRLGRQNHAWTLHFSPSAKHGEGIFPQVSIICLFISSSLYAFICSNTKHLLEPSLLDHGHFLGLTRSEVPPSCYWDISKTQRLSFILFNASAREALSSIQQCAKACRPLHANDSSCWEIHSLWNIQQWTNTT